MPKQPPGKKPSKSKQNAQPSVRAGGTRLHVFNSGLEVWLYDDANRDTIRNAAPDSGAGGMPGDFEKLTKKGLIVGYSLCQDDGLDVEIHVGPAFTDAELSCARWLEPQTALLSLPSGKLCVESNDASRVGPEEPTDQGGLAVVPAGNYLLTLYRIDHEALSREKLKWSGPQEIMVLTPGGKPAHAVSDLLPFQPRRDQSWVGQYKITGQRAEALAWFSDYWDTCIVNLDSAGVAKLGLEPGRYFQIHVPAAKLTLIHSFAKSWAESQRLPPPAGVSLDNYGYAAVSPMGQWKNAEAILCRRQKSKTRVEEEHHDIWLPAVVEILDAAPLARKEGSKLSPSDLAGKQYFDAAFLGLVLADVLPGADDEDEFPLPVALEKLDAGFDRIGYAKLCDVELQEEVDPTTTVELCCRLYTGTEYGWAVIFACPGIFDVMFVTEFDDGTWLVTGLADDFQNLVNNARYKGVANEGVAIECRDEELCEIASAHQEAVEAAKKNAIAAPSSEAAVTEAFKRFGKAALG